MALKDLFKKKEKEERPVNPNTLLGVRVLAVGYLIYCLWSIIKMYMEGGEDAPSLWIVVLGGGAVFIAVVTIQKIKQLKDEERARLDEEDALLAAQEESEEEDFEEEEILEDEETSEEE